MSGLITVWCRGEGSITRRELAAELEDAGFLDDPEFDPPPDSDASADPEWATMEVRYDPERRPILLRAKAVTDDYAHTIVEEMASQFGSAELESAGVTEHVLAGRLVVDLEIDTGGLTDDGWEACDHLEVAIAQRCDGLVYVVREGIYDADLQPILKIT